MVSIPEIKSTFPFICYSFSYCHDVKRAVCECYFIVGGAIQGGVAAAEIRLLSACPGAVAGGGYARIFQVAEYIHRGVEGQRDLFFPEVKQVVVCRQPFCQAVCRGIIEAFTGELTDFPQIAGCKGVEYQCAGGGELRGQVGPGT
ncbi:hypothetical protein, partial [uncultured Parabacteroides sp.]|uniref:hypothetical protein n=1 Tax=uncultured Parabacteroides sp. TaxID=512312 RepID=UPI0025F01E06